MKTTRLLFACAAMLVAQSALAAARSPAAQAALKDIEKTLGFVPGFLKALPDSALPGAWAEMRHLELGESTALPPKYKELIGLGVASQIPCRYCISAHTEFAKGHGATAADLGLAVAEAGLSRHWSAWVNGMRIDEATFRSDLGKMVDSMKQMDPKAAPRKPAEITDPESAFHEMQEMFGFVPGFMKQFPAAALPGAWTEMRDVEMLPHDMPAKYISLIGLAVSSQIPCHYCVDADTAFARAQGATPEEIAEAVAMAAQTRNFSTLLNGMQIDEASFKADLRRMTRGKGKLASR